MSDPPKRAEIVGLQYLRGVAAMMVVVYHLGPMLGRIGYAGFWPSGLAGGVDLFFVISGFVMWRTTVGREIGPLWFWRRRIARIVPLYWLATSAMVVMLLMAPGVLQTSRFDPWHVIASYLFVPWPHPVKGVLEPVVMPGWTLDYEMAFYLVFGVLLAAPQRWRLPATLAALGIPVLLGWLVAPAPGTRAAFYSADVLLEFGGGIVLAWWFGRGATAPRAGDGVIVVVGALYLLIGPELTHSHSRFFTLGIGAIAVVAGMLAIETRRALPRHRLLHLLGDASYAIYLSQMFTMAAVAMAWRGLRIGAAPSSAVALCLLATLACAAVGVACHLLVERPLIAWFRPPREDHR